MDIKQLKYFVVSADMNSFSGAAKVLYTTQSNISKSIQSLEKELGSSLFLREARGISLTSYGKKVYQYAFQVLENMEELENISKYSKQARLNISTNPSSWFAARFCEFYNQNYDKDYHFHIRNSSTTEILNRIHDGKDEIGFLYIFEHDKESFQYLLKRNGLKFTKLSDVQGMLYLGKQNEYYKTENLNKEVIKDLRYIQMYQDEFMSHDWTLDNVQDDIIDTNNIAVITNSDYIMEQMLTKSLLANISSQSLSTDENIKEGYPLYNHHVVYGMVQKDNEELSFLAKEFFEFIKGYF